jgi:pimeloyl-ACP methyl ester carboxylesterase
MTADPRADTVRQYRPIDQLLPAHWQQGDVFANGISQHYYRTVGSEPRLGKPPLYLLHGFLEGALSWLRIARILESDFDVIMPDARGHGLSDRMGDGYGEHIIDDAAALIRSLTPDGAHILGFSQGAGIGVQVADRYPELVRSLILAGWSDPPPEGAPSYSDMPQNEAYMAWFNGYVAWLEGLKAQTHEERMASSLGYVVMPGQPLIEDDYVGAVENAARLDPALVQHGMTMWASTGQSANAMNDALARVTCPTLLIKSGMWATPGAPVTVREEPSDRPNVRIFRFANAGHLVHREAFDEFMRLTQGFLAENVGR